MLAPLVGPLVPLFRISDDSPILKFHFQTKSVYKINWTGNCNRKSWQSLSFRWYYIYSSKSCTRFHWHIIPELNNFCLIPLKNNHVKYNQKSLNHSILYFVSFVPSKEEYFPHYIPHVLSRNKLLSHDEPHLEFMWCYSKDILQISNDIAIFP